MSDTDAGGSQAIEELKAELQGEMYQQIQELEEQGDLDPELAMEMRRCVRDGRTDDLETLMKAHALTSSNDRPIDFEDLIWAAIAAWALVVLLKVVP